MAGTSIAAVAVPLGLHPVVPFLATAGALAATLAVAVGAAHALERLGLLARRWPRALLALSAVVVVWDRHLFVSSAGVAPDDILAVAAVVAALLPIPRPRGVVIVGALAVASFAVACAILIVAKPYHSDAVVAVHGGAQLLLEGRQPYADFDMTLQLRRFGLSDVYATPLEDGTRLRLLQYPALAILLPAPLIALGLADVRILYLVEVLVAIGLVVAAVRGPWRAAALALCLGGIAVTDQFVLAGTDPAWALLALAAWLARGRRWPSALLLGLAIAARQPAWLIAPFLVAWAWRERGATEAAARGTIALALALLLHVPFLLTAPAAVVAGITAPALLPLEPWGVGPAKVAADLGVTLVPRAVYLAAAGAAYLVALWAYVRGWTHGGALALPLVPLWLSWRALVSYFAFLGPFVLVVDDTP